MRIKLSGETPGNIIVFVLLVLFCAAMSFLVTSGIIKLISMCFGFVFTWKLALGIWLALCLLGTFIGGRRG